MVIEVLFPISEHPIKLRICVYMSVFQKEDEIC